MANTNEINFNFESAKKKADELDEIARNISAIARKQENEIVTLQNSWKSDSATRYIAKANATKEEYEAIARRIADVASSVRNKAKAIYDAEMKAAEIAKERTAVSGSQADAEE